MTWTWIVQILFVKFENLSRNMQLQMQLPMLFYKSEQHVTKSNFLPSQTFKITVMVPSGHQHVFLIFCHVALRWRLCCAAWNNALITNHTTVSASMTLSLKQTVRHNNSIFNPKGMKIATSKIFVVAIYRYKFRTCSSHLPICYLLFTGKKLILFLLFSNYWPSKEMWIF